MNISTNTLGFTSKINIVNNNNFENLPLIELDHNNCCADFPFSEKEIFNNREGFAEEACCCSAGGITDGKNVTMFHLIPENKNISGFNKIEKTLIKEIGINNIDSNNKFNGLIVGGKSRKLNAKKHNNNSNSRKLFSKIKEFFEKNNISYSVIWGHKQGGRKTNCHYSAENDTWTISTNSKIKKLKDLKRAYEFIHISDKDELYINDKKIELNK